jgi:hypothetical protein
MITPEYRRERASTRCSTPATEHSPDERAERDMIGYLRQHGQRSDRRKRRTGTSVGNAQIECCDSRPGEPAASVAAIGLSPVATAHTVDGAPLTAAAIAAARTTLRAPTSERR